jgi:hypothetical protein
MHSRTQRRSAHSTFILVRGRFSLCGRCWVRTNVGGADGFTDLPTSPLPQGKTHSNEDSRDQIGLEPPSPTDLQRVDPGNPSMLLGINANPWLEDPRRRLKALPHTLSPDRSWRSTPGTGPWTPVHSVRACRVQARLGPPIGRQLNAAPQASPSHARIAARIASDRDTWSRSARAINSASRISFIRARSFRPNRHRRDGDQVGGTATG